MEPFRIVEAPARALPLANIDTDQLIPARFMKRPRSEGYGSFLLHDLRFDADGAPRPDSPLPQVGEGSPTAVMVARRNFGCGSSREAAVYALADYGVRCVIAPSFGDIFASNAVKNGLLPARVSEEDAEALLASDGLAAGLPVRVDLEAQTITAGNLVIPFAIDPVWRTQLLNGWDDIDLTRAQAPAIAAFRERDSAARPWATPGIG
jgi:3-isopropylmalate/(R)-2-methylmalate dehydratase small subunit